MRSLVVRLLILLGLFFPALASAASQTVSFAPASASAIVVGGTGKIYATATSGLPVAFTSSTPSVCTVGANNTVNGIALGTCNIAADQAGNANYAPATKVTQNIIVRAGTYAPKFAYAINGDSVGIFTINPGTGALTFTTQAATGSLPSSVNIDPTGKFAYVVNGGSTYQPSNISAYTINPATGALSAIVGSPFAAGAQLTSLTVDPTGKFAYVTSAPNNTPGTVSAYTINRTTGALTGAGLPLATGYGPLSVTVDPSGKFAYVLNSGSGSISAYTINPTTGSLTAGTVVATPLTTLGTGASPKMIVVDPTGRFAYVANNASNNVLVYTIDPTTGTLTAGSAVAAGTQPNTVTVDPTGRFAYVLNSGSSSVSVYSVNPTTGALTQNTGSPFGVGSTVQSSYYHALSSIAVDPTGRFAYASNHDLTNCPSCTPNVYTISVHTIDPTTGALTAVSQTGNYGSGAAIVARIIDAVPDAPTIGTATAGTGQATVSFTAPASDGGAAITGYTATSNPGGLTATGTVSPLTVTGLTPGTAYTFTVTTTNSAGIGSASASSNSVIPIKADQNIGFGVAPAVTVGGTGTVSATASSGLAVIFSSTTPSVCSLSGSTVTATNAGTCIIAANQAGNVNYTAAPQVTQSITVGKINQTIGAISFSPATLAVGGTVTATATATSVLAPSYSSTTPAVCTVSGSAVTGITAGTCTIVADQAGDANYNAATQVSQSITVKVLVFGTVTDLSTGSAIAGAAVSVTGGTSTQTDVKGYYQITGLNPGLYAATFSKSGYQSLTVSNVLVTTLGAGLSVQLTTPGLLNITTTNLPHAEIGVAYSSGVRASGGTWPYVFSVASGTLPSGLSLDATNGNIVGTPSLVGAYTFAIGVTDKLNAVAEREFTLEVTQPLSITNASALRRGTLGADYFQTIQATGGTQPYTWLKSAGSLPAGLAIASNGNITGKPTALGTSQFTERVTDASSRSTEKNFSLEIVNPLLVSTARLNNGIVGSAYNQTLSASGGHGNYSWAVYSGSLPAGLALDSQTGIVTGSPTAATYGIIVFSVSDEDGRITYKDFSITVSKPLKILVSAVPNGLKNAQYSEAIRLEGGIGPYVFSSSGQLPAGLALNSATGVISGIPTAAGLTNVNITVTDSTWPVSQTVTQLLGIRVTSLLTVTSSAVLPMERRNIAISPIVLVAQGGSSPYGWELVAGYLPQGFALNPQTGELSGTPLDSGDFVFRVKVTDAVAATAEKEFFWHISDALTVDTGAVADGAVGVPYSFTVNAKGGLPLYSWRLLSGTLPNGLSINGSTGTLSGTPSTKQTFQFTVEVSDADNPAQKAEKTYSMDVLDTLFVYTNLLPNGRVNEAYTATVKAELGTPPYSWRLESGALPAGLSLASSATVATIEGTPTAKGSYAFYIEVSDSGTPVKKAIKQYTGEIYGDVTIDSTGLKTATRGVPYSDNIAVSGGALPYSYSVSAGVLPSGLNFNSISGNISGITNMPTGFSAAFKVKVSDSGNPYDSNEKDFVIYVVDPLSITTQIIQGALQGSAYQANIAGLGGLSPYTWSAQSGLPAGLQIDPATGVISGTPAGCGVFNFNVHLSDAAPLPNKTLHAFDLNVTCSGATTTSSTTTTTTVATTTTTTQPQGQTGAMNFDVGWNLAGNGSTSSMDVAAQLADTARITSVWKWINARSTWAFYAPSMSSQALADYAAGKGYEVLSVINGGEGFWVNAKTAFNATLPAGTAVTSASFATALASGWSLISTGDNKTPRAFNNSLSATPPAPPAVAASVLTTLWAWNSTQSTWYFYAPTLDNSGGLAAYVASKGYLDFGSSTLVPGMGFWVNRP